MSVCRLLNCNNEDKFVTKNTALHRYLQRDEKDMSFFYGFVVKTERFPLLTVCINCLVHIDFAVAPVNSSAEFTKSLSKSTTAPVG
jgi:hypothetical protein